MIFLAVVNGQPKELGLVAALQHFIDHRVDVVRRRTAYLLARAREREHVLEGYKIALDNLDAVIKLIRASASRVEAREGLMERFKLSTRQADAILELQLHRLTQLAKEEIIAELKTATIPLRAAENPTAACSVDRLLITSPGNHGIAA